MKKQCDFSDGARGKFHRKNAALGPPVYLDKDVQAFVQGIADPKQSDIGTVVNEILKFDMRLAEVIR